MIYNQIEMQLIEAVMWLGTSDKFYHNFIQIFFNYEFTGVVMQSEYFEKENVKGVIK